MPLFFKRERLKVEQIITRLKKKLRFGLFDIHNALGGTWYFEDGRHMKETDLWEALRIMHNLQPGHGKTLKQLCPRNYEGSFSYTFREHEW
jgi:hypothetical protein